MSKNDLYPKSYRVWAGNPRGTPPDFSRCCGEVRDSHFSRQCTRSRGHGPDGAYCHVHDPEKVKARRNARERGYIEGVNKKQVEWHGAFFLEALRKIEAGHNNPRSVAREAIKKYEESLK